MPARQDNVAADVLSLIERAGTAGISISELTQALGEISRRTLQRTLRELAAGRRTVLRGQGPAARYFALPAELKQGLGFATTTEAERVFQAMQAPLGQRRPVAYNPSFIASYRPNVDFHLSGSDRRHLREIGTIPLANRADTRARDITSRLLIDLSWASSHMEGNTYDLLSTERLILDGVAAAGKSRDETQMILNHKSAIEFLLSDSAHLRVDKLTVCNLHALLAENLLPNPADAGRVRTHPVNIGQSTYLPLAGGTLLDQALLEMLDIVRAVKDPYEQAFCLFIYIPYLQPFIDVNKRTSRLAANIPLLASGLCPLSFLGVEPSVYASAMLGVYELNDVALAHDLFVYACERSVQQYLAVNQTLAPPNPLRLTYRTLIFSAVAAVVRERPQDRDAYVRRYVVEHGVGQHAQEFDGIVSQIKNDVEHLHEGNIFRYGIQLSEFQKWAATVK